LGELIWVFWDFSVVVTGGGSLESGIHGGHTLRNMIFGNDFFC
jgi:hypothetical protein